MMSETIFVPFDAKGNMQSYPEITYSRDIDGKLISVHPKMKENYEFDATLKFKEVTRGQSACRFILLDEDGHKFFLFPSELLNILKNATVSNGSVSGKWNFVKKGQNYSIRWLQQLEG